MTTPTILPIGEQTSARRRIEPRAEFSDILRNEAVLRLPTRETQRRAAGWLALRMRQAGWPMRPKSLASCAILAGALAGGAAFLVLRNAFLSVPVAVAAAWMPIGLLARARHLRRSAIRAQLPAMVDQLIRTTRTGRSLEQSFESVAESCPAPLGAELRQCAVRLRLGIPMTEALADLPVQTGVASLQVLVLAFTVHHESGCDVVDVLERLARSLRRPIPARSGIRASATVTHVTALLMLAIPAAALVFLLAGDPESLLQLVESPTGRTVTLIAALSQASGTLWLYHLLRQSLPR